MKTSDTSDTPDTPQAPETPRHRSAPLAMDPGEFRDAGYRLIDQIAGWLGALPEQPVTRDESPAVLRALLGGSRQLPEKGRDASALLDEAVSLLVEHSLFNGHPRFMGYITSSAAPIGALGDALAAAVNPNVGLFQLAPIATEIEAQVMRWIAEMLGYPPECGGLLVSGGNMANFVGFLAARKAKARWDVRTSGMNTQNGRLLVYASRETHTWLQKAADLFGLGTDAIRWIAVDDALRMDTAALRGHIQADLRAGDLPFLVVGSAGTVSTGAVDPLPELAAICREYGLWFHVDGAYGALAALLLDGAESEVSPDLRGIREADSVAVDPHKWLYAPIEAGCVLVRDPELLRDAFSFHPPYYHLDEDATADVAPINYYEYGPQNSRSFRALKVWLALRQAGREGYVSMIADDIHLARELYRLVGMHPELQAYTQSLSITTLRYVPPDLIPGEPEVERYLNALNAELLTRLQKSGEAFLSNAVIGETFVLRACIVNFRTSLEDVEALPAIVARIGRETDAALRPAEWKAGERSSV